MSDNAASQRSGLSFVGQSVTRVEDERLLIGEGRYVADVGGRRDLERDGNRVAHRDKP